MALLAYTAHQISLDSLNYLKQSDTLYRLGNTSVDAFEYADIMVDILNDGSVYEWNELLTNDVLKKLPNTSLQAIATTIVCLVFPPWVP